MINAEGKKLQKCHNNYLEAITKVDARIADGLYLRPVKISKKKLDKLVRGKANPVEYKTYRNVYDLMATILASKKPVFTMTWAMRETRINHVRIMELLTFMKHKKLITIISSEELPKNTHGRFLRVTVKGYQFLQRYTKMLASL